MPWGVNSWIQLIKFGQMSQCGKEENIILQQELYEGVPWWLSWERICLQYKRLSLIPGLGRSAGEGMGKPLQYSWASLVAHLVKTAPALWETWIWSLDWEDPLEKGLATHRIMAWRIQDRWVIVESPDKMWSTGEGNGKPLQYYSLEKPMNNMKRQKDKMLKDELPGL